MKLTIKVTKEILRDSMYCGIGHPMLTGAISKNCAIAKAVRELFPNAVVSTTMIFLNANTPKCMELLHLASMQQITKAEIARLLFLQEQCAVKMNEDTKEYVCIFDGMSSLERLELPEHTFTIEVPSDVLESIDITEAKRILSTSSTMELV